MPTPATPLNPQPAGDDRALAAGGLPPPDPSLDERLHGFWKRNGQALLWFCGLVVLGYLGKAGWEYFADQREAGIEQEFSSAMSLDQLKIFAAAHPGHRLAGVAELRLGDAACATGRYADAISRYSAASSAIKTGPLAARAQLGLAMAKVQSGETADGEASLRQLAEDVHQYRAVRAEATYQLASLAAAAGRAEDVRRLSLQLTQIDPNSPWMQRAYFLQALLPPTGSGQSAISLKPVTP